MPLDVGKLRHRITIERPVLNQDATTGEMVRTWETVVANEPAAVEPLSVRDFLAAQALQSAVTLRVTIRFRAGLTADMRLLHGSRIYNPQGWLADPVSGIEYLTAPCSEGVNDG
jgi:SPP1 family predicted phage head-tail adaptor